MGVSTVLVRGFSVLYSRANSKEVVASKQTCGELFSSWLLLDPRRPILCLYLCLNNVLFTVACRLFEHTTQQHVPFMVRALFYLELCPRRKTVRKIQKYQLINDRN